MGTFTKYFNWNRALVDYYFVQREAQSVILYVDDNILNIIGEQYGIQMDEDLSSFKDDFYRAVLLTLDQQREFLQSYRLHIRGNRQNCHMRNWRSDDVYRFGALLANNPAQNISCPALSYAIFTILAFQGKNRNQWNNVREVMREHLPNMHLSPQYLMTIFQSIEREYPQFDSGRLRGTQPYVGRISYHLVLTASERFSFGCLLARRGIRWDSTSDESYVHFVQSRILPNMNTRDRVRQQLMKSENTPYFQSFLENFDPNDPIYDRAVDGTVESPLFLYFKYEQGSDISCGTPTYVARSLSNETLSIPRLNDSNFGLYPVYLRNNRSFSWSSYVRGDYRLNNHCFHFREHSKTIGRRGYYLFGFKESCGLIWVVQTDFPEEGHPCLIVTRSSAESTEADLRQTILGQYLGSEEHNPFSEWFDDWNVYHIASWNLSATEVREKERLIRNQEFKLAGGIRHPHSNNYFPIAPPYIYSETVISPTLYHLQLARKELILDGNEPTISQPHTSVKSGHHIIINDNFEAQNAIECTVQIQPDGYLEYLDLGSFIIEPQHNIAVSHSPFRYDKWGRPIMDEEENYLSENAWHGNQGGANNGVQSTFKQFHDNPIGSFKLVTLLADYANECDYIKQEQLNKIIKEVAIVEGYGTLDYEAVKEVRFALIDLGYMNRSFIDNQSVYQMNPTSLVFTQKTAGHLGPSIYLVYGAYTPEQLRIILNDRRLIRYQNPFSEDDREQKPYLNLLPDFILYFHSNNQLQGDLLELPIIARPFAYDILSHFSSMQSFEHDFPFVVVARDQGDNPANGAYPKLSKYNDNYCIETRDGYITHYERDGHRYLIPHNLMKLYVRNSRNLPIFLINGQDIYQTKDMGLPSLFKKAFCELNWELPKKVYAFGMYGCLGNEPLYSEIKLLCSMSQEMQNNMISKLSGGRRDAIQEIEGHDNRYTLSLHIIKNNDKPTQFELHLYFKRILLAFTNYYNRIYKVYVNKSFYYSVGTDASFTALNPASNDQNANYILSELMDGSREAAIPSTSSRWDNDDQLAPQDIPDAKVYPVKIMRIVNNNNR